MNCSAQYPNLNIKHVGGNLLIKRIGIKSELQLIKEAYDQDKQDIVEYMTGDD